MFDATDERSRKIPLPYEACRIALRRLMRKAVVLNHVETGTLGRRRGDNRFDRPMFGVLQRLRPFPANRIRDVLAETKASGLIQIEQGADFVIAQSAYVKFVEIVLGAIYEKLADILIPKRER